MTSTIAHNEVQTNKGIRIKVIPGARFFQDRDEEVDPRHQAADSRKLQAPDQVIDPGPGLNSSSDKGATASQPVSAKCPPTAKNKLISTPPATVSQKPSEFKNGNARSRAPIWSGDNPVHEPEEKSHRHEKDHDVAVGSRKISWKCSELRYPLESAEIACWNQTIPASSIPRKNMSAAKTMYIVPIFLGSVEVSHSFQSQPQRWVFVRNAAAARIMIAMVTVAPIVYQWWGSASRVSFPKH